MVSVSRFKFTGRSATFVIALLLSYSQHVASCFRIYFCSSTKNSERTAYCARRWSKGKEFLVHQWK